MKHVDLEKFANGAFSAQVNRAIEEVTENIQNPNTDAGATRKITGNTMSYTPETDLLYENYIKDRFLNKCNGMFLERGKPVTLRIVARFLPPKSTSKKRTALMLDGKELPLKKPDIDNIVKVVADGEVLSGRICINYVDAPNIYPVTWNNGRVTECIFAFPHTISRKKYVQLQSHLLENGEYVISNTVLRCESGSQEGTELTEEEWKLLKPFKTLAKEVRTGSAEPQFVIDRLNITNNADQNNPMGVAIFANAIDTLKKLDTEYDSYCNEFELGRKRIFVRPEMLTNEDGSPAFDPDDSVFYALPEDDANGEGLLKEIDMSLRADQHSKAINDDLNYLSLKCGFGTDRYQFGATGAKTATEIISENSDMYRMIKKHEILLEDALKQLIRIIIRLGMVLNEPLNPECEITIDFDDSIIEDKETERSRDRQDVSMGVMSLAEYRAKWYGESEEDAAKNLPEQNQVME